MPEDRQVTPQALTAALVEEVAAAIGSLLGTTPTVVSATTPAAPSWSVTVRVGEPTPCAVVLGISRADGTRLARLVTGAPEDPPDAVVLDTLKNIVGQATGALRQAPLGAGLLMLVDSPEALTTAPEGEGVGFAITAGQGFTPIFGVWTSGEETAAATPGRPRELDTSAAPGRAAAPWLSAQTLPANLDVVLDIDLPLSVRFGQTDLTLDALTRLGPGSLIDLGRSPEDPVDVLVNGRLVARAEVVVVNGNYGVRVLEVVSTADRVRTLGA